MHSQHSKRKRRHARSQWPDAEWQWPEDVLSGVPKDVVDSLLSWPDLDSLLSGPDVPLGWTEQDLESLLRLPDDLLKALDAPLGWADPAEWQWPDGWPEW